MTDWQGKFIWYELTTPDVVAAQDFYRAVLGWDFKQSDLSGAIYTEIMAHGLPMGGMMPPPSHCPDMRPGWLAYIAVDDVDAYAGRVAALGGSVHHGPADIPHVGRFAMVAGPDGAVFALFKGNLAEGPPVPAPGTPGRVGWHELYAGDGAAAFDFYHQLFGWGRGETHDMGPMGMYQLFTTGAESCGASGGMMTKTPDRPAASWLFYFNTDRIDAAIDRVKQAGGKIMNGPHQVPGGGWIAQGLDPQGAAFALLANER